MDRDRDIKLADGLYARYYASGKRALRAQFNYQGTRCRETFKGLDPNIKADVRHAKNRVGAILHAIATNTFSYREFFPESTRAARFGGPQSRTIEEIGEKWLSDVRESLAHSTVRAYEQPLRSFVFPAIGKKRARDVTAEDIRDMFRGKTLRRTTMSIYAHPLREIFKLAMEDEDVLSNPMDRVNLNKLVKKSCKNRVRPVNPYAVDEINAILAACKKYRPGWHPYFTFAFYSGVRTGEQYGLQWDDWRGTEMDIHRSIVMHKEKDTKNDASHRTIYLSPMCIAALKEQRHYTAFAKYIFWNPYTKKAPLYEYLHSQRALRYICSKAGVQHRNQYQTRHSYATNMLLAGESPHFVAKQLGHANLRMLYNVYGSVMPKEQEYIPRGAFGQ